MIKTNRIPFLLLPVVKCALPYLFALLLTCVAQHAVGQISHSLSNPPITPFTAAYIEMNKANISSHFDTNIRSIMQDKNGHYWFGSNNAGVYCYDGTLLIQFTKKDGLADNQISNIVEDKAGNIWFSTGLYGVTRFDGKKFTTFSPVQAVPFDQISEKEWNSSTDDLWFCAGGGVYRYHQNNLLYHPLNSTNKKDSSQNDVSKQLSAYGVYSILKDSKGHLWFGTQNKGVCRYDGKTCTWFTEKGLAGPAVLCIYEDSQGMYWFGNNGAGLFMYDGKTLTNFTEKNGMSNSNFMVSGTSDPGLLQRVYAINEDNSGNLWIGAVDSGVWRYDGKQLSQFTVNDGLTSNAVNSIYKDSSGMMLFGTDADGICVFNGNSFSPFQID